MALTEKELAFLKGNSSWSSFYASLLSQYENKGELSPKQVACVISGMEKQAARETEKAAPAKKEYTLQVGQTVAIKRWLASSLAEQFNVPVFFRNLRVDEVNGETARAYQVKVSFSSRAFVCCNVCGRPLDNALSRATGIGPVCADKLGIPRPTLETAEETLKQLDSIAASQGSIGPFWLPKSQMTTESEAV